MNKNKKKLTKEYKHKYKLGQFFTSDSLVDYISKEFSINYDNKDIIEPSFGGCSFISFINSHSINSRITAIDIDKKLCEKYQKIYNSVKFICSDFLDYKDDKKYDIIIGNPPFNLKTEYNFYDTTEGFLIKSLQMLKDGGCLYFVMPSTILRNKQYENLRKYIINDFKIEGIINTSNYEFLGADIETIVIGIRKQKVSQQKYFYLSNGVKKDITLSVNKRNSILLNNINTFNELKNIIGEQLLQDVFNINRGNSKDINSLRGRQINYYNHFFNMNNKNEFFVGLQNIAYRFTSNLIKGDKDKISDTVTILSPKKDYSYKYLCFISEFLNSSIANYLLHVNVLNGCKLTIHIDKYYIDDLPVPMYNSSFEQYINTMDKIGNTFEAGEYRNNYFYKLLNLNNEEINEIESIWTFPKFKSKQKFILKEVA